MNTKLAQTVDASKLIDTDNNAAFHPEFFTSAIDAHDVFAANVTRYGRRFTVNEYETGYVVSRNTEEAKQAADEFAHPESVEFCGLKLLPPAEVLIEQGIKPSKTDADFAKTDNLLHLEKSALSTAIINALTPEKIPVDTINAPFLPTSNDAPLNIIVPVRAKSTVIEEIEILDDVEEIDAPDDGYFAENEHDYFEPAKDWKGELTDHMNDFNSKFAVVLHGSKALVMKTLYDDDRNRNERVYLSVSSLNTLYSNEKIKVGEKTVKDDIVDVVKTKSVAWLDNPMRLSYRDGIIFKPSRYVGGVEVKAKISPDKLNLWEGYSVQPIENHGALDVLKYLQSDRPTLSAHELLQFP